MKYLSKLLSILLVGSMLCTVGCVKDDIRDLNKKINNVQTAMDEQFAEVEKNLGDTQTELDDLSKEIEADKAELAKLKAAYEAFEKAVKDANYAQQIKDAVDNFNKEVADLKNQDEAFKTQLGTLEAELKAALEKAKTDLSEELEGYKKLTDDKIKDIEERIADAENRMNDIQAQIDELSDKLAGLIQNITFIPEYTDGLATAVRVVGPKGASLTATTLTAVFEVTPASAVNVLAEYGCVAVEPLKTRAEVLRGERLVVEPIEDQPGRVKVTAFVHNMPEDFNSYAFTLNVEVEGNAVAASDFVYIHEGDAPEYQYILVTAEGNEPIENHPAWDAEREALVFETKWTKAPEEPINALEGYVYKLTNDGGKTFYTLAEIENKFGMTENALAVARDFSIPNEDHAKFVKATADATIDMAFDNEYDMYQYINDEAEVKFFADNDAFLEHVVTAYYKVVGSKVVDNVFTIEEVGDLYWLSQNQDCEYDKIVFAENLELDMARYCAEDSENAPFKAISPVRVVSIEGNYAIVKNIVVDGADEVGLFGFVKGNIENLTVKNIVANGNHWVGGIAGCVAGTITNCHVEKAIIKAEPRLVDNEYDDGDKAGGIVGYSMPDTEDGPSATIVGCSVKDAEITAFRDVAGIVGAMNYGDNLKDNRVENITVVAEQRQSQAPGYVKDANLGRILGRDILGAWKEAKVMPGANQYGDVDLRIRYAIGAEVNVDSFDATEHALEISTANGLAWFSQNVANQLYYNFENVKLVNDIDFEEKLYFEDDKVTFVGISNMEPRRMFDFDGMGNTIRNFKWDEERKNIALFGIFVGDIKNVKMENVTLKGLGRVAPIAAQCWGHIDNCHVNGLDIKVYQNAEDGDKLGGIVAQMQADGESGATDNLITNCSVSNAEIEGYRDLGALAGMADLKEYDNSNKFFNVSIWVNQLFENYEPGHEAFKNEHEVVGRIDFETSAKTPEDVDGVDIFQIIDKDLYRRYVVTPNGQLRLGYNGYTPEENAVALWKFAEEYKEYNDVFQAADIKLAGQWTPIGSDFDNAFVGVYNGNGKAIEGLLIENNTTSPSGLFGCVIGTLTGIKIVKPTIYGSHWAGAVAAVMYGSVSNCEVAGGKIILAPTWKDSRYDDGDKAGALVGYLAASGDGTDKICNNTVKNVTVKAYRDVAALVGCANNIDLMSGNTIQDCSIVVDQVTFSYPANDPKNPNIGMLIGDLRADTEDIKKSSLENISNNTIKTSTLGQVVDKGDKVVTETIANINVGSVRE